MTEAIETLQELRRLEAEVNRATEAHIRARDVRVGGEDPEGYAQMVAAHRARDTARARLAALLAEGSAS